jgi:hypothetical protein
MTIKKIYNIGDPAWIHGVDGTRNYLVKGQVVHVFEINGYHGVHYVVAVPTGIEDLLEIRTWETISQDEDGPIGAMRDIGKDYAAMKKVLKRAGLEMTDITDTDIEPTPEQIHAAIEISQEKNKHKPLILKPNAPKRRRFNKRKKPA